MWAGLSWDDEWQSLLLVHKPDPVPSTTVRTRAEDRLSARRSQQNFRPESGHFVLFIGSFLPAAGMFDQTCIDFERLGAHFFKPKGFLDMIARAFGERIARGGTHAQNILQNTC